MTNPRCRLGAREGDLAFHLTVTDTATGAVKTYANSAARSPVSPTPRPSEAGGQEIALPPEGALSRLAARVARAVASAASIDVPGESRAATRGLGVRSNSQPGKTGWHI